MNKTSEIRGATNAPNDKTIGSFQEHNMALNGLQVLRDIAWQHAIKYRFDPVLSRAHQEYLNLLNGILMECEA